MKIYTTVDSRLQNAAQKAAVINLLAYDERHGYRGAVATLWKDGTTPWDAEKNSGAS